MTCHEDFMEVYSTELKRAIVEHPDEYAYPVDEAEVVVARMSAAIARGSYNKDGRAFKATCKALGIAYTYSAINAYIRGESI